MPDSGRVDKTAYQPRQRRPSFCPGCPICDVSCSYIHLHLQYRMAFETLYPIPLWRNAYSLTCSASAGDTFTNNPRRLR